ncbi:MAG: glycogen debranching protein GlgX [Cyanobacteria bacterium]|nr:glycogen debranching protein GlgX [Cyanobacteriota bacterium]
MTSTINRFEVPLKGSPLTPEGSDLRIYSGSAHPFGATVDDDGVNFSVYSANATGVQLLLFNSPTDLEPSKTIDLNPIKNKSFYIWHIYIEGLKPGSGYAYRVDGPNEPWNGHRFNPAKVLVDPYSKGNSLALWERGAACGAEDNLHKSMRSVVIDTRSYDWEGDMPLRRPMSETIIYEMHVAGFTKSPTSAVKHPGTFKGLIEKIPYLKEIGITAVELLPVFSFDHTDVLRTHEGTPLVNYWGYSTMGYFAPHQGYCTDPESGLHVEEFRDMVKALHKAGIEVILDVVFNHTDEGNHQGPMFSFKGFDNSTYYYLTGENGSKDFYYDYTGCGNTFNCNHPIGEKLILDCLRFWVEEMHVDGFRFDEGSVLTRGEDGTPLEHPPVIWSIELDDILGTSKVIAEAWDAAGLYQIGYFPGARWAEWNGKYRDSIRQFVKGDAGVIKQLAARLTGSADLYQWRHHEPVNSVNFITAHDGFTLYDLCSYNEKHNWANGEGNNDGVDDNMSWNCGVEGETNDPSITQLRKQQVKNFGVLLMCSLGVPMIVGGDEHARSQKGNNNTYCQDNALNWYDWDAIATAESQEMVRFWSMLNKKRFNFINHFKGKYFSGKISRFGVPEISWHGTQLNQPNWDDPGARCLAMTFGDTAEDTDGLDNIHIMMNMYWEPLQFEIPHYDGLAWHRTIDTSLPSPHDISTIETSPIINDPGYILNGRSIVVLTTRESSQGGSA